MSQDLEKETTSSTAWSIIGAFSGLGTGFLFLCLIMGAVTYRNAPVLRETPDSTQKMINTLDDDFLALAKGGAAVVADKGVKLRLFVKAHNVGNPIKVIYQVNSAGQGIMLSRQAYLGKETEQREVIFLDKARFVQDEGAVGIEWTEEGVDRSHFWATHRWDAAPVPKPPAKPAPKPKGKK